MCNCLECEKRSHELTKRSHERSFEREIPTTNLAALGLYPSERMTITGIKSTLNSTGAVSNATVVSGNVSDQLINPVNLHRLPGLPINAYPLLKDIAIVARLTAGTAVTPFTVVGFLLYRDNSERLHVIGGLSLSGTSQATFSTIILPATPLGENAPSRYGSWEVQGTLVLGTATEIAFDIWANIGVLYGVPK